MYGTVNINTSRYASPVYLAKADTPLTRVAYNNCQGKKYPEPGLEAQWAAVPIPAGAEAAGGTDAEMTVYLNATNTLWEFWQAKRSGSAWEACWGGKLSKVSASDGIWPHPYGTTAIGMSLFDTEAANIVSWPARRSDGQNPTTAPDRIPKGLRFRLDPTIDVDKLRMGRAGKIIAKAAQKYGFVVWDRAGALSIRAQGPASYAIPGQPGVDPCAALLQNKPSYAVLDGFPWGRLQLLPPCRPGAMRLQWPAQP